MRSLGDVNMYQGMAWRQGVHSHYVPTVAGSTESEVGF